MYEGLKNLEVPRTPSPHRIRRFIRIGLFGFFALTILAAGLGFYTYREVKTNVGKGVDARIDSLIKTLPGEPINVLVIGSDSREGVKKADRKQGLGGPGGRRADVIMLLHIMPNGRGATLVSLPRDLRVDIPGYGTNKINAAYAFDDSPNLMIRTVKKFTRLPIHHYIEVNFFGFRGIVDAVGGVPLYIDREIHDDKAKLDVPSAGCWVFDGDEALAYVRARNFDPTADIGRIQRQQGFLRELGKRVASIGIILQPNKLIRISEEAGRYFNYNEELVEGTTFGTARAIAAALTTTSARKIDFRIVPYYTATIGGISYVIHREAETAALFKALRKDRPLPEVGKTSASVPDRSDVSIQILNGTKKAGFGKSWTRKLDRRGYDMATPDNTSRRTKTVILYDPGEELKADLVKKLFPGARVRAANVDLPNVDIRIKLGADQLPVFDEEGNRIEPTVAPAPSEEPTPDQVCRELP